MSLIDAYRNSFLRVISVIIEIIKYPFKLGKMRFNRPFFLISGPPSIFSPRCVRRIASLEKRPKLRHWGLGQQFSPGCKTGHHKGKNANKNIHATNTKEQV